jgi:hypothetical protein
MVLAMIVLTALATLSALTVVSVQGGIATSSNDRFHTIALYAAESGGAVAMDYLRKNVDSVKGWSAYVTLNNSNPKQPPVPGNNAAPGAAGNPFSPDMQASYNITIYNNRNDPKLSTTGEDGDFRIIIRSTGYGPNGAMAILEWEITAGNVSGIQTPCEVYAQKGMSESGAGRNDCLGSVSNNVTSTKPGGP